MKTVREMEFLNQPFMVELKDGDINAITLRDYIVSVIKEEPIEVAFCEPFIFRTDKMEYTMNAE